MLSRLSIVRVIRPYGKPVLLAAAFLLMLLCIQQTLQWWGQRNEGQRLRLMSAAFQDLVIQSPLLIHLKSPDQQEDLINDLKSAGFDTPNAMLSHLEVRLRLLSKTAVGAELLDPLDRMSGSLTNIRQSFGTYDANNLGYAISAWFRELQLFNGSLKAQIVYAERVQAKQLRVSMMLVSLLALTVAAYLTLTFAPQTDWFKRFSKTFNQRQLAERQDPLTGLLNQFGWESQAELHRLKLRQGELDHCCMVVMRIDHYGQYVSTFGDAAGETRLATFAELLRHHFRPIDVKGRLRGEEFGLLLVGCEVPLAQKIVQRFRVQCEEISFSSGVVRLEIDKSLGASLAMADLYLEQTRQAA